MHSRKRPGGPFLWLQAGYFLDESDPDILVLRREDGSFVAAFSAVGATKKSLREAAEEDQRQKAHSSHGPCTAEEAVADSNWCNRSSPRNFRGEA